MINKLLILLIAIAFVRCSGDNEVIELIQIEDAVVEIEELSHEPKIDVTTEIRHAYIKEFVNYNSANYLIVDYADYFEGKEAGEMERRDKAYVIIEGDTMTGITDGYYISNMNNKLRTFRLKEDAEIRVWTNLEGYELYDGLTKVSIQVFKRTVAEHNILWILTINKGVISSIEQQFQP